MSVHYKFKSTLHFDTITFDGLHISVADLKKEIVLQKRLGKVIDFDLQITNAQSKEEYKDDNFLIPKNTTLIISRIPIANPIKKGWDVQNDVAISNAIISKQENLNMDLSKMEGSEEEKIQAMMMQSTAEYDPKTYHRIKGQSQMGEVPSSYRCNKCKKGGHWIKNCLFTSSKDQLEVKRNTGIPRSFRGKNEILSDQETSKFKIPIENDQDIPEDLICGICRNIFVDAVMIPCCGSSFCDDCVRNALLESEENECPDCKEKSCSPGSLIPNRFLRNSVNVFKNESGLKLGVHKTGKKLDSAHKNNQEFAKSQNELKNITENEVDDVYHFNNDEHECNSIIDSTKNVEVLERETEKVDSDYEDNITIQMPQTTMNTNVIINSYSKNKGLALRSPTAASCNTPGNRHEPNFEYKSNLEINLYSKTDKKPQNERSLLPTPVGGHQKYSNINSNESRENSDQIQPVGIYKPNYIQMPRCPSAIQMSPYNNGYNNMVHRPPISFGTYANQTIHQMNSTYIPSGNISINHSQNYQSTSLASIYQGVAAKVGSGLIDDPLEAFNRIMKEKEKQKEDRRRSPDHHRCRSPGRQRHRFNSPVYDRDLSWDAPSKEKRPRSRDRKREYSYEKRQNQSIRHSNNGSRSPSEKKRYSHRRSPPIKSVYKSHFREQMASKDCTKMDTIEPPPPGFEALQIGSLTKIDKTNKKNLSEISRNAGNNARNLSSIGHHFRSLTPPSISSTKTEYVRNTPDRKENTLGKVDKNQTAKFSKSDNEDLVLLTANTGSNIIPEPKTKLSLELKDKKKKKKGEVRT